MIIIGVDVLVIGCIPVENEKNATFLVGLGGKPGEWPLPPPYKNSSTSVCEAHGGDVWLGPKQQVALAGCRATGRSVVVLCLVCLAVLQASQPEMPIVKLSNKDSRRGD